MAFFMALLLGLVATPLIFLAGCLWIVWIGEMADSFKKWWKK